MSKRGKFIVFEGVDGSGKTTQIGKLANRVRGLDKYQEVLLAREPTWMAGEIRNKLENESDPYKDGQRMSQLYIGDRARHYFSLIKPALDFGVNVLCDRFSLSTLAYQSVQGVPIEDLVEMHKVLGIPSPDLTLYLQITPETAKLRKGERRGKSEKFERQDFASRVIVAHDRIVSESKKSGSLREVLGEIETIDANGSLEDVETQIWVEYSRKIRNIN